MYVPKISINLAKDNFEPEKIVLLFKAIINCVSIPCRILYILTFVFETISLTLLFLPFLFSLCQRDSTVQYTHNKIYVLVNTCSVILILALGASIHSSGQCEIGKTQRNIQVEAPYTRLNISYMWVYKSNTQFFYFYKARFCYVE